MGGPSSAEAVPLDDALESATATLADNVHLVSRRKEGDEHLFPFLGRLRHVVA